MIKLYDTSNTHVGELSEQELQFLIDNMEEESTTDQDYYLDEATVDYLEARGADLGFTIRLRQLLAGREGITIRWARE